MSKPVLLLDVDGVVNATSLKPPTHIWPADQWITTRVRTGENNWPILAAKPVLEFLRQIHSDGLAEIRWHTTWQDNAQILADALDLPYWSVAYAPEFEQGSAWAAKAWRDGLPAWWKIPAAQRVLHDELRSLIWVDDELVKLCKPGWSYNSRDGQNPLIYNDLLLINPDSGHGLASEQIKRISSFLFLNSVTR